MRPLAQHRQTLCAILFGAVLATTGWAQDADEPDEESGDTATQVEATAADEPASEESVSEEIDVDDGSYLDAEEDDFRPSEEIPADQSITFPTDI